MARITKPLTFTEVQTAKARPKEYNLADGDGLYLRVKPNGKKFWLFNYTRPFTRKRSNISIGTYPVVTLEQARRVKNQYQVLLNQDIDPKEHREKEQQKQQDAHRSTLEAVASQWLDLKKTKVSEDHADDIWRSLEIHILPDMGNIPVHKIGAARTIDVMRPIAARGSLETVKRLCQRLNEVMTYAVNTGLITHNPLIGIREAFATPQVQHMPSIHPDRLPELMRALQAASIKRTTRCLIEFQLHTMTRPAEAAGARWDEINLDNELWVIPAERMKKKREHKIPLTAQVLSLLEVMRPISGSGEFVFPGDRNPGRHTNKSTANMAIKRMGYNKQLVSHGLRSIASTALNEQGFDSDLVECSLAHVDKDSVRKAYNRADYLERRREMLDWWSNLISKAAMGDMSLAGWHRSDKN